MKPKTEELLYLLLYSCEMLARPTFRNLTDSFEAWAYRNGFRRQLGELERLQLLERRPAARSARSLNRVLRLTEVGRIHALGGRDPEARWRRGWDGRWHLVVFDLPLGQEKTRDQLRRSLRKQGFGYLQQSVWISPDPLPRERQILTGSQVDVESLILLEARPSSGETDEEIVAGAWDFSEINERYAAHLKVLAERPSGPLDDHASAESFRKWASLEQAAWLAAVAEDPLLPAALLPPGYLGRHAWRSRVKALSEAAQQTHYFHC